MFISYLFTDIRFYIFWVTIMMLSVCVHELSHALCAYWQGDDTAKMKGYFTLNPLIHMGKVSIILLLLMGLCWGLCPVNVFKMRNKYSGALVAFAGPFSNLLLSMIFALFGTIAGKYQDTSVFMNNVIYFCWIGTYSNAVSFIFNLVPLSPLDGSKVAEYLFPKLETFYGKIGANGVFLFFVILTLFPIFNDLFWASGLTVSQIFYKMFDLFI